MAGARSEAKLYVILGSHACRTGILLVEHKGIGYRLIELPTGLHPIGLWLRGFRRGRAPGREVGRRNPGLAFADRLGTVPALKIGSDRIETSREIARFLERLQPEPPLFPADPERRREVEEAERWGDEVFQMTARRLALAGVLHGPDALHARGSDGRLGPLLWHSDRMRFRGSRFLGRFVFAASPRTETEMLDSLPAMLDWIDGWIGAGVLNGDALNAADYMVAPSLALLCYRKDLGPMIEARPCGDLVNRVLPERAMAPA